MKKYSQPALYTRLYAYLQQALPTQEGTYILMGLYAMAAVYIGFYNIDPAVIKSYRSLYTGIYQAVLWVNSVFITFPIWPPNMKSRRFIAFFWPLGISAIFFFVGMLLVIISQFQPMYIMVLMINVLVVALVLSVPLALLMALSGISSAIWYFSYYTGESLPWSELSAWQGPVVYILLLLAGFLITLFNYQKSHDKNEVLSPLDTENQVDVAKKEVVKEDSATELAGIDKDLEALPAEGSLAAKLHDLESELIPAAFQLQGIDTRLQSYLHLRPSTFSIQQWLTETRKKLQEKGISQFVFTTTTQQQELFGDFDYLISLLTKSIIGFQGLGQQQLEEPPTVFVTLEDTQLSYPLPDVAEGYMKYVQALRIVLTKASSLPLLASSYEANLASTVPDTAYTTQALAQLSNLRVIKAHYGYEKMTPTTLIYVIPVNVKEVRPRDMDRPYMALKAAPQRANDHFKNNQIDAKAQETAFLTAVAAHSQVNVGLVKVALELIKWYHGPVERHSGEPFYLHPLAVAQIVLDYNQDKATVLGALLHDIVEDTSILLQQIALIFGQETAEVVQQITHLQRIPDSSYRVKLSPEENLHMLEKFGQTRGLYIKLADRMHNMRTIEGHDSIAKQKQIATETLQCFVPVAERLALQHVVEEFNRRCRAVLEK